MMLNKRDEYNMIYENIFLKYMEIAKAINEGRIEMRSCSKCVAIYTHKKKIISIGINKCKTHPILLKFKYDSFKYFSNCNINKLSKTSKRPQYPIHAELDGYIKILNTGLNFDTLYLYRGNECDLPCMPCIACSSWLKRINKLIICYVNSEGIFESIDSSELVGHNRREFSKYKKYNISK